MKFVSTHKCVGAVHEFTDDNAPYWLYNGLREFFHTTVLKLSVGQSVSTPTHKIKRIS